MGTSGGRRRSGRHSYCIFGHHVTSTLPRLPTLFLPVRALRLCAGFAAITALCAAGYWSVRLAWADCLFRIGTVSSVERAAALAPSSAEYHVRLAGLLENGLPELERAITANPRMAAAWMMLGLRAERQGDARTAESYFARAAEADRTYTPLWTLANFHFRQDHAEKFWPAARRALRTGDPRVHDPTPLFELCRRMSGDNPGEILERAIPDIGPVQARYLGFLIQANLTSEAEPVTQRVIALAAESDLAAVFGYCDRLIEAGATDGAIRAWNALCWKKLHGYAPLAPARGVSLTNGDFSFLPVEHGFDWRSAAVPGASVGHDASGIEITFDGRQPENCELLAQYVPLVPSRKYRLGFRYQTDGIRPGSGLRWRIQNARGQDIPSDAADLASFEESKGAVRFTAPDSIARLTVWYQRAPGTTRIEGRLMVRAVTLEFDP